MSFPRYEVTRHATMRGLGEVPNHWREVQLRHVLEFTTGWTPPTGNDADYDGDNLWANISDLGPKLLTDTAKRISDEAVSAAGLGLSEAGSLLFSFKLSIGQVSFVGADMYTNEAIATFRQSSSMCLPFCFYALPIFLPLNAAENIYGAKLLNQRLIQSAPLLAPPIDEQHAIATFLDRETAKIDTLIAEQERLIALLQEKRQAVISHAVTKGVDPNVPTKDSGVEWIGAMPAHWKLPPVADRYHVELGKMLDEKRVTGAHLTPYLRNINVQWDEVGTDELPQMDIAPHEAERYLVREGDLLVCEGGEIGRAAIWDGRITPCGYQKALHRLRAKRNTEIPRFMLYTLRHAVTMGVFKANGNQSTIPHLTAQQLRRYRFPTPPVEEQRDIATYLDRETEALRKAESAAQAAVYLLAERRTALITAAVTGQIDVRGLVETAA